MASGTPRTALWAATLAALVLSGCPALVEDEFEVVSSDARGGATSRGGTAGTGARSAVTPRSGAGGSESSAGAPETPTCGALRQPEAAECPAVCSRCENGNCVVECVDKQSCKDRSIACPAGFACVVECEGEQACEKATIECPADFRCRVACGEGPHACKEARVACGDGVCELACGDGEGVCEKTALTCGRERCEAKCGTSKDLPRVLCGPACECITCEG